MDWLAADDPVLAASDDLAVAIGQVRAADLLAEAEPFRAQVLGFLADHPDALHRSCLAGHLTGSAVVVDPSGRRVLLLLHRKLGRWFQPGGHADGDANLAAVALREATEETGLSGLRVVLPAVDLDVHEVPDRHAGPHLHLDLRFVVSAPSAADAPGNHESLALRWVEPADLAELGADASTERLVRRGLAVWPTLTAG